MIIRKYRETDINEIAKLFYNTVHDVNRSDYSEEQLNAWASGNVNLESWNNSFLKNHTFVVEINGIITGFGDITTDGYLNMLYIHKNYQRQGIATAICNELEKSINVNKISVHASITAKGFFEKKGYKVVKSQKVKRKGVYLKNYLMQKEI
ncbi:TPA: GNAT family N-acetyltransferase [bacterium]|nr:GNAT family N-acetyltransferase [bacterium]